MDDASLSPIALLPEPKSNRQPVFDNESGTYICGEQIAPGYVCKGTPIAPLWKCVRHGGNWSSSSPTKIAHTDVSIYTTPTGTWKGFKNIRKQLTEQPRYIEQLYSPNLDEELAVSRIILAELMQRSDKSMTSQNRDLILKALRLISNIAKIAKEIHIAESSAIHKAFMDEVIIAISQAFTRANSYSRPSDRARIFMQEFTRALPGAAAVNVPTDPVIESESVSDSNNGNGR